MSPWLIAGAGLAVTAAGVFAWALCNAASRADHHIEHLHPRHPDLDKDQLARVVEIDAERRRHHP